MLRGPESDLRQAAALNAQRATPGYGGSPVSAKPLRASVCAACASSASRCAMTRCAPLCESPSRPAPAPSRRHSRGRGIPAAGRTPARRRRPRPAARSRRRCRRCAAARARLHWPAAPSRTSLRPRDRAPDCARPTRTRAVLERRRRPDRFVRHRDGVEEGGAAAGLQRRQVAIQRQQRQALRSQYQQDPSPLAPLGSRRAEHVASRKVSVRQFSQGRVGALRGRLSCKRQQHARARSAPGMIEASAQPETAKPGRADPADGDEGAAED